LNNLHRDHAGRDENDGSRQEIERDPNIHR
jgi:hypothetical protein